MAEATAKLIPESNLHKHQGSTLATRSEPRESLTHQRTFRYFLGKRLHNERPTDSWSPNFRNAQK
jgi:hypothetical protein